MSLTTERLSRRWPTCTTRLVRNGRAATLRSPSRRRSSSAEGRADVDHALVLDRHEGCADRQDHVLDVGKDLVVVTGDHLDLDLVDRARVQAGLAEFGEEPVAVGDPRSLDVNLIRRHAA